MRRLADISKLAPDPEVDSVQLDPAAPSSARSAVSAGLSDGELLRRLHATEMACQATRAPADQLRYLEGFKELRKAARERLLQPDT